MRAHGDPSTPSGTDRSHERHRRMVRLAMYAMLVASASVTVLLGDTLWTATRAHTLPVWASLLPPATFTAFVVVYTVDRWLLVRRRNYPLSRALFQMALALFFLALLLQKQAEELRIPATAELGARAREPALQLLAYPDEVVRAATCELLHGDYPRDVVELVQGMAVSDPSARVRAGCHAALARLHGGLHPG